MYMQYMVGRVLGSWNYQPPSELKQYLLEGEIILSLIHQITIPQWYQNQRNTVYLQSISRV